MNNLQICTGLSRWLAAGVCLIVIGPASGGEIEDADDARSEGPRTFYVDSENGQDSNGGRSEDAAWRGLD